MYRNPRKILSQNLLAKGINLYKLHRFYSCPSCGKSEAANAGKEVKVCHPFTVSLLIASRSFPIIFEDGVPCHSASSIFVVDKPPEGDDGNTDSLGKAGDLPSSRCLFFKFFKHIFSYHVRYYAEMKP